jgi:hypothetical protein
MIQDDLVELMTVVLDGSATPQQLERFHARLEIDSEARRVYAEVSVAGRALERRGAAQMPPDLRDEIRQRILIEVQHQERVRKQVRPLSSRSRWRGGWIEALRQRPVLGLVPAFAAGAAAGILIMSLVNGGGLPRGDGRQPLGGTLGPLPNASTGVSLGRLDLGAAEAAAWTDGALVTVNLDLSRGRGDPIYLDFDPSALRVQMIQWPCGTSGLVDAGSNLVVVTPGSASCCEIIFRPVRENMDPKQVTLSGDVESMTVSLRSGS